MTLNSSKKDNIEQRREIVARLRLRGMSLREIATELEKQGIVSPITGRAFDHTLIKNDIDALKALWRESAGVSTDEHAVREFMELQELKRLAWSQKDGKLAVSALGLEMKLLGTMKQPEGLVINIQVVNQLVALIEQRGESAEEWMNAMIQEFQLADRT